ncbi:hypothetical protein Tco_1223019 [Tanacetum coccineum]
MVRRLGQPRDGSSGVEMMVWCWLRWRRGDEIGECDVKWRDEVVSGGAWRWGGCWRLCWFRGDVNDGVMQLGWWRRHCGGAWDGDDDDGGGRLWLPEEVDWRAAMEVQHGWR